MVKSDFLQFSAKDFILDDAFQQWVSNSGSVPSYEWKEWLTEFPERNLVVEQARSFLQEVAKSLDEDVALDEAESGWMSIESRLI